MAAAWVTQAQPPAHLFRTPPHEHGMTDVRTLFVSRKWPPAVGGMETYSVKLAEALDEQVSLRRLVLPGRANGQPPTLPRLLWFFVRACVEVAIRARSVDLLIVGDFVLAPLVAVHAVINPRGRRVVIVHGLDLLFGRQRSPLARVYRRYVAVNRRLIARRVTAVVANSSATADVARSLGLPRVTVVRPGVDVPDLPDDHVEARDRNLVIFVGRLVPRKGAGWFAEEVLPFLPDPTFVVAGPGGDPTEIARIENAPRAHYLGPLDAAALADLRRRAWIAVMPNIPAGEGDLEGFGLASIEAAAAGCVVVASGVEGVEDAIQHNVTGVVVPPLDRDAWIGKVTEIQGWGAERFLASTARAVEHLRHRYTWTKAASEILSVVGIGDGETSGGA